MLSLDYSRGFYREGCRLLERLDKFYVNDWDTGRGRQVGVVPGTTLSDHVPVIMTTQRYSHLPPSPAGFQILSLPERRCALASSTYGIESGMIATTLQRW